MMFPGVNQNLYNISYYNEHAELIDFQDGVGPFISVEEAELWAEQNLNEVELLSVKIRTIKEDYAHCK